MDTDSSSYYETTYSEDERIVKALREERRIRDERAQEVNSNRQRLFEIFSEGDLPIYELPGLKFHTFRHTKIKFSFHPATLSNFVNKNVIFYVSLKYVGKYWRMRRDSLPANYKWKIYKLFYDKKYFRIDDDNIFSAIEKIYDILVLWTQREEKFRLDKIERYKKGEDVDLDTDDEQLFLDETERVKLYQRRVKILKRMLPPKEKRAI